jgi:hypothetical protein
VIDVQSSGEGQSPPTRRRFAAKYHHRRWGVALAIIGGLFILGTAGGAGYPIIGLILVGIAVYLLRGQGTDPKVLQGKAARMDQASGALQDAVHAGQRGAAVVAYRNLQAAAQKEHPKEAQAKVDEALASIGVDPKSFESPQIGAVPSLNGNQVEVFRDWIICGQEAHDVDANTRGDVHVDGSVQVVDKKQVDTRTAQLQFVSTTWSMSVAIPPDKANQARMMVAQLAATVDSQKPQGVTAQDMKAMVDAILNNTGQPPAEKLTQLSNLRYQRLLSDEEFEQAKSKILGIS